jgi:hypothetical protein
MAKGKGRNLIRSLRRSNKRRKKLSYRRKDLNISCSSPKSTHISWLLSLEWLMILLPRRMRCSSVSRVLGKRLMLTRELQESILLV